MLMEPSFLFCGEMVAYSAPRFAMLARIAGIGASSRGNS
jgi:hypothetical protein